MKLNYLLLTFLLASVITLKSSAQPMNKPSMQMNIDAGNQLYEQMDYYGAINFYREAYNESKDLGIYRKMAFCYFQIRDFGRANRYFDRLLRDEPEGEYDLYFTAAQSKKMLGLYDEAKLYFRKVLTSPNPRLVRLTEQELKGMVQAGNFREDPKISIKNAGDEINGKFGEIGPVILDDNTLLFSNIDARSAVEVKPNTKKSKLYSKLYQADLNDKQNGKALVDSELNNPDINIAHSSLSPDGTYLYYQEIKSQGNNVKATRLMVSKMGDDQKWSKGKEIQIPTGWLIRHSSFAVFRGKSVVFFTANAPGGKGGDDIYYSEIEKDGLGTPRNLGAKVNTVGNEWTPFFSDNKLYFSSTGWPGMGGHDVFYSIWNGGEWSAPINMESSVNSETDDFGFKWNASGEKAVLLSNRPGGHFLRSETCCDDIYVITRKPFAIASELEVFSDKFQLEGSSVELYENIKGDYQLLSNKTSKTYSHFLSLDTDRSYKLVAKKAGHYPDSMTINTVGVKKDTVFNYSLVLRPLPDEPEEEIVGINQVIRLNNIYYDFDDDKILPESEPDLTYLLELLNKYDNMVIELSSHTDARGKDAYNKELSQRRAKSAKRWLVQKDISPSRIRAIGYGETRLLNRCLNGVSCTDDEHRFNRRTEFKIIEGPQEIRIEKRKLQKKVEEIKPKTKRTYSGAHIGFENTFVDLGIVKRGSKPTFSFKFTNDGQEDLLIEIVTGCECTELDWPTGAIRPGQSAEITATLNSSEKKTNGQHNFDIDVVTNTKELSHILEYRAVITD